MLSLPSSLSLLKGLRLRNSCPTYRKTALSLSVLYDALISVGIFITAFHIVYLYFSKVECEVHENTDCSVPGLVLLVAVALELRLARPQKLLGQWLSRGAAHPVHLKRSVCSQHLSAWKRDIVPRRVPLQVYGPKALCGWCLVL